MDFVLSTVDIFGNGVEKNLATEKYSSKKNRGKKNGK